MQIRPSIAKLLLVFLGAAFAAGEAQTAEPNLTGKWNLHTDIHGTKTDLVCTFVQTKVSVVGNCTSDKNDSQLTGTVDGRNVKWSYDSKYFMKTLKMNYMGVMNSDKLSGEVQVDPFGVKGIFSGERAR